MPFFITLSSPPLFNPPLKFWQCTWYSIPNLSSIKGQYLSIIFPSSKAVIDCKIFHTTSWTLAVTLVLSSFNYLIFLQHPGVNLFWKFVSKIVLLFPYKWNLLTLIYTVSDRALFHPGKGEGLYWPPSLNSVLKIP